MWTTSTPYTIILVIASAVSASLGAYALTHRRAPAALPFMGLMASSTLLSIGYAFELASGNLSGMLFWTRVEYIGIVFLPVFWVLLAARTTQKDRWLSRPVVALLFGFSALTLVVNITNSWHHLYYTSLSVDSSGPFPVIAIGRGAWYWAFQAFTNVFLAVGTALLIANFWKVARAHRRQTGIMILGALVPWLAYFVYELGGSPHHVDLTPFGLAVSGPIFALALFRYRLLDLVPVAREAVFTGMSDGVVVMDAKDRLIDYNPAAQRVLPGLSDRGFGGSANEVLRDYPQLRDLISNRNKSVPEVILGDGPNRRYYHARLSPITDRRGEIIGRALLLHDATAQAQLEAKLRELASIDELTGALNRRHFAELGNKEINRAKRSGHALSVIIIDLDHFKAINDRWGHEAGDMALKEASNRIKAGLRAGDSFGRHGGEEFSILLPETPQEQAGLVAERLRVGLASAPIKLGGGAAVTLTASLGTAGVPRVGEETLEDLIRAADRAMYQAKAAGRNCVRGAVSITTTPA